MMRITTRHSYSHFHHMLCRVIRSISHYPSMNLILGWRPHQFMFLIALQLGWLWIPSLRYWHKTMLLNTYKKSKCIATDFVFFGLPNLLLDLLLISFMSGVLPTPLCPKGIAFCLQHVKHTRLCLRVQNSLLMCLHHALQRL